MSESKTVPMTVEWNTDLRAAPFNEDIEIIVKDGDEPEATWYDTVRRRHAGSARHPAEEWSTSEGLSYRQDAIVAWAKLPDAYDVAQEIKGEIDLPVRWNLNPKAASLRELLFVMMRESDVHGGGFEILIRRGKGDAIRAHYWERPPYMWAARFNDSDVLAWAKMPAVEDVKKGFGIA